MERSDGQKYANYFSFVFESRLFDENHYADAAATCGAEDLAQDRAALVRHYLETGMGNGLAPNPFVDEQFYLERHPDVTSSGIPAFLHFVTHGIQEGRMPSAEVAAEVDMLRQAGKIDIKAYNAQGPDMPLPTRRAVLLHYILLGETAGFRLWSESEALLAEDPGGTDAITRLARALRHREQHASVQAAMAAIRASGLFDATDYTRRYPDIGAADIDPLFHYVAAGESEGRLPTPGFDPSVYLALSPDLRDAGINAFAHYIEHGKTEGRLPEHRIDQHDRNSNRTVLFVGHDAIRAGAQMVLLEIVKWFSAHTDRHLKVLLLGAGDLTASFAEHADTYVCSPNIENDLESVRAFCDVDLDFVYFNTVVTGRLVTLLGTEFFADLPVAAHIHEMSVVISEFETEFNALSSVTDCWITASRTSAEALTDTYGIQPDTVRPIEAFINPVCTDSRKIEAHRAAARQQLDLRTETSVVMGVGTVYWRKGPDDFVETAIHLLTADPDADVTFVWVGDGDDRAALEHRVSEAGLGDRIRFAGYRKNASELVAAADILFLSSREDPFPLVCLEAAQYAVPTVCFDKSTGITDFIKSDAGIVLPTRDAADAADRINDLLCDRIGRITMGATAFRRVHKHNTADRQIPVIESVVRRVLNLKPSVSVIVPNYNHERFIEERLSSITNQTVKDIEIILLDDMSTDRSPAMLEAFSKTDERAILALNTENSGSPFLQWRKGLAIATGDVIWIAESDDCCDEGMLAALLPAFRDPLMSIAHGKTINIDQNGAPNDQAIATYLSRAHPERYTRSFTADGIDELSAGMGFMCTLVNASGALFRKSRIEAALDDIGDMRICGDWYLYVHMLLDGKIHYNVEARNYFRRHSASVIHKWEGSEKYFRERYRVAELVVDKVRLPKRALRRIIGEVGREWKRFRHLHPDDASLSDFFDIAALEALHAAHSAPRMRIALYIHGFLFSRGGIEKLGTEFVNALTRRGHEVFVYCRNWGNSPPIYPIYEGVTVRGIFNEDDQERTVGLMRQALIEDKIDIFVPMLSEFLFEPVLAAAENTGVITVASEHNDPWQIEKLWWDKERRHATFAQADHIHLLLENFRSSLPDTLADRIEVIPNGVSMTGRLKPPAVRPPRIIAVGRLVEQKRFDLLVSAFERLADSFPDWCVDIFGEGNLRDELQAQIDTAGLSQRIRLRGNTDTIHTEYEASAFMVMPSDFEGFGIVVVEAMSDGLPVVAFRHCNGPNEIISDGQTGTLVMAGDNPVAALADAMSEYMSDPERTQAMGLAATRSLEKYELQGVLDRWEMFLQRCIAASQDIQYK